MREGRIQTQRKSQRPNLRTGKGLSMHQSRPNTWTKLEEGRHEDHVDSDLTCEQKSKDEKRTDPLSEESKKRMYLGNALVSHLCQKVGHCRRHQRCVGEEEMRYLGKRWDIRDVHCTNWAGRIYKEKTPEQ